MISSKLQLTIRKDDILMPLIHVKKNYQITIPSRLRNALKIKEGDLMEAEVEGESIVLKPKSIVDKVDKAEIKRQEWIDSLIQTGIKSPVDISEEEIVRGCQETRKEVYKEIYGEEPK